MVRSKAKRESNDPVPWLHGESAGVIEHPKGSPHRVCPACGNPLDQYGRCARCMDWCCRCGTLTGSFYISTCNQCARDESNAELALERWKQRMRGKA